MTSISKFFIVHVKLNQNTILIDLYITHVEAIFPCLEYDEWFNFLNLIYSLYSTQLHYCMRLLVNKIKYKMM